jgi:hypothetical protein
MKTVFGDTSCYVALMNPADSLCEQAGLRVLLRQDHNL